jgi:uncharacterized protein (DUF927 family)
MTTQICNPSQLEGKLRYPHNYEYKYHEDKLHDGIYVYIENGEAPPIYEHLCHQRLSISGKFYSSENNNYCFEVKAENIFTNEHGIIQSKSDTEICSMSTLSTKNSIIKFLSDKLDITITELNYKHFVKFFNEFLKINKNALPTKKSTSRLGWNDGLFAPVDNGICFDYSIDNGALRNIVNNVKPKGTLKRWKEVIKRYIGYKDFNFIMGTSMASVLLKPLGVRSYTIIPMGDSENGKTFAAHCGLSIYGKPSFLKIGSNDTQNAILEKAYKYQNICLLIDDPYRKGNDTKGVIDFYAIANEKNRGRLDKNSALGKEKSWRLTSIITTESTLIKDNAQAGEHNRILEYYTKKMYKKENQKQVERDYEHLEENYGLVLPLIIDLLSEIPLEQIKQVLFLIEDALSGKFENEKLKAHIKSVSMSCLGSYFLNKYFLSEKREDNSLVQESIELGMFILDKLIDKKDSVTGKVALEETYNYFSTNYQKFQKDVLNERYGTLNESKIIFIIAPLKKYLENLGYNFKDFKKYAVDNKLAEYKQLRINGVATWRLVVPLEQPNNNNDNNTTNKKITLFYTDYSSLEVKSVTLDMNNKKDIACLDTDIKYFQMENNNIIPFDLSEYIENDEKVIETLKEYAKEKEVKIAINRGNDLSEIITENEIEQCNDELFEFDINTGELKEVKVIEPNRVYISRKTYNIMIPRFTISTYKNVYIQNLTSLGVRLGENIENLILRLAESANLNFE